jgi:hypothetical protein
MNDHETILVERKRDDLYKERRELEEELFKRMPIRDKVHSFIFSITLMCSVILGLWLVAYIGYKLIFKSV